jgi:protein-arginine kinase activator protein McsA
MVKRTEVELSLNLAMEYFMEIEEYEKCAEIRDLMFLIK